MGGIVCWIPKLAILRFDGIPTHRKDLKEFDEQIRACYSQSEIVQGVFASGRAHEACDILAKQEWSTAERATVYEILQALYADED